MLRELPLEIKPFPTQRKFEPFGCVCLLAIYSVSVGALLIDGLLAFKVVGRESTTADQAFRLIVFDVALVTFLLWLLISNSSLLKHDFRKFWLRLDENGLTIRTPKEKNPRFVNWDEMRAFSIESVNSQGQVERWATLWGKGDTILAQWTGIWHHHAPRQAEIEEYIQFRLSAGQSVTIEHNRAAHLWAVHHLPFSHSPEHEETIFQIKSRVMENELASTIGIVLYFGANPLMSGWNLLTVYSLLFFGVICLILLLPGRPTLRVSSHQIEIRFGQQHSQMAWDDVKAIKMDHTGRKLVFEGHAQTLVYPGPTYWNRAKRRDLFYQLLALSEQYHVPIRTQALTDLPAYTHQPKEVPRFKRKFYLGKKR